jgi:hypothetical protein
MVVFLCFSVFPCSSVSNAVLFPSAGRGVEALARVWGTGVA